MKYILTVILTMKQIAVITLLVSTSLSIFGQGKPEWLDENYRRTKFPASEYYTGFALNDAIAEKPLQEAERQIKADAQTDLTQKIRVQITVTTQVGTAATNMDGQYSETESIDIRHIAESSAELIGLNTESYYDPVARTVYAFSFVKREDLANYYKTMIQQELNRAETAFALSEQLAESGKKQSAIDKAEEAKNMLGSINSYRNHLVTIDSRAGENALQNEREKNLLSKVEQLLIQLNRITLVFVDCRHENRGGKDDAFQSDPGIFCGIIEQALSENNCSATANREEAEYELTLVTSTTQRSDGTGQIPIISYYANVKGSLYNRNTSSKTADFTLLNDPAAYATGRTPEDAATKAFKLPALKDKVMGMILPKIKE